MTTEDHTSIPNCGDDSLIRQVGLHVLLKGGGGSLHLEEFLRAHGTRVPPRVWVSFEVCVDVLGTVHDSGALWELFVAHAAAHWSG